MKPKIIFASPTTDPYTGNDVPRLYDAIPCTILDYGPVQGTRKVRLHKPWIAGVRTITASIDDLWRQTPDGWERPV